MVHHLFLSWDICLLSLHCKTTDSQILDLRTPHPCTHIPAFEWAHSTSHWHFLGQTWWYLAVIPASEKPRHKSLDSGANLGYMPRSHFKQHYQHQHQSTWFVLTMTSLILACWPLGDLKYHPVASARVECKAVWETEIFPQSYNTEIVRAKCRLGSTMHKLDTLRGLLSSSILLSSIAHVLWVKQ